MVLDAVARFIPGVLGKMASAEEDSFSTGFWNIRSIRAPLNLKAGCA